jgi:hypothetical protein
LYRGNGWRLGLETSRAELGSARCGSVTERARLGSARPFHELAKEARLGSGSAREPYSGTYRCIIWWINIIYSPSKTKKWSIIHKIIWYSLLFHKLIIFARLASWLGSARCKNELEEEARLGSFEAHEPLRAEPSRTELEPAREPRANFQALVETPVCRRRVF